MSVAAQTAATQQTSLAPLFANLDVAAGLNDLPPQVQQAVAQVLAQQTSLDPNLTGADVKQAFQSSGLFLEASLASGSAFSGRDARSQGGADRAAPGADDVARRRDGDAGRRRRQQRYAGSDNADDRDDPARRARPAATQPGTAPSGGPQSCLAAGIAQPQPSTHRTPTLAPPAPAPQLAPGIARGRGLAQGARVAGNRRRISTSARGPDHFAAIDAGRCGSAGCRQHRRAQPAAGSPCRSVRRSLKRGAGVRRQPDALAAAGGNRNAAATVDDAEFARTNVPPPPIGGALPAAQPVMPATLVSNSPAETAMHHLLADTDGAIARQTLLQVASLPDRVDSTAARLDPATPRWNFEIPFATPQGTAMAQFEISRDGGGNDVDAARRVWRARFSLDVEPAGPVHALISLNGDKTSVRMWAERPATAAQLRAGAGQLSQALSRAELKPGDIVIRDGAPLQPAPARPGIFWIARYEPAGEEPDCGRAAL